MLWCLSVLALLATVQGRAVNISNTWVLPEEGFPVFYRYFRDRISWYEADAVCQFHHANLVTVDTTAQYDAVRAYLKELDISSAVWVGLIRSNPEGDFTWTDYRGMSGDGYWITSPDSGTAPLCAAANPAADYRWEARACGGPMVASFICELPVPQWASGPEGCMVRALPALTVLYLPESAAVQLTADCGLAGVKRVQCTGNLKREELLRDLSCAEEAEENSTSGSNESTSEYSLPLTTESPIIDQGTSVEITTEDNITTEIVDKTNLQTNNHTSTIVDSTTTESALLSKTKSTMKTYNAIPLQKKINLDIIAHNFHSNDISRFANDNSLNEEENRIEDEKLLRHKQIADEISRLGSFDTLFAQSSDHFVPPMVMAKAKISNDMTELSLQEKHKQIEEEYMIKQKEMNNGANKFQLDMNVTVGNTRFNTVFNEETTTSTESLTMIPNSQKEKLKILEIKETDVLKHTPKKYNDKLSDMKSKKIKTPEKSSKYHIIPLVKNLPLYTVTNPVEATSISITSLTEDVINNENLVDLTVMLKEPSNYVPKKQKHKINENSNESSSKTDKPYIITESVTEKNEISSQLLQTEFKHEILKLTIVNEKDKSTSPITFEVTTKVPVIEKYTGNMETKQKIQGQTTEKTLMEKEQTTYLSSVQNIVENNTVTTELNNTTPKNTILNDKTITSTTKQENNISNFDTNNASVLTNASVITNARSLGAIENKSTLATLVETKVETTSVNVENNYISENITVSDMEDHRDNSTFDPFDDFQSPLLSGANEPVHKPNRQRRPVPVGRIKKFNPFRILG